MNSYVFLKNKFEEIKSLGCHVIPRNSTGDIGNHFETMLGLSNNDFSIADFNGIELKVKSYNSPYPINLFSLTCDGPDFFELRRFVDRFGICDKEFPHAKILSITLSSSDFTYWGKYKKMKLTIDKEKEKIFILVTDSDGCIIEQRAYWDFSSIKSVLERKLSNLCYINAKVVYSSKSKFVWYDNMRFYKLRSFNHFIELLDIGKINISIKYGVYRSGLKAGKPYDHGTSFILHEKYINDLFSLVDFNN